MLFGILFRPTVAGGILQLARPCWLVNDGSVIQLNDKMVKFRVSVQGYEFIDCHRWAGQTCRTGKASWLPEEVVDACQRITNGDDIDGDWQEANKHIKSFAPPPPPSPAAFCVGSLIWRRRAAEMCTRMGRVELKHPVFRSGWSSILFCDSVHTVELPFDAFLYFMAHK